VNKERNPNNSNQTSVKSDISGTSSIAPRVDSVLQFSSRISVIFQDSKEVFWFVSQNEGVCLYDGEEFVYFTAEELPQVRAIQEDEHGNLWFGIKDGVRIFDGENFTTIYPEKESVLITESFEYSENNFEEQWKKQLNGFWFSAFNKNGVYHYDGEKLTHLTLPVPKDYPDFGASGYHPDYGWDTYAVYGIYKDNDGNMWLGTPGAGLFRYYGKSIICVNEDIKKGVARAIYQDKTGKIWFGNNALGLYHYDGKSLVNFTEQINESRLNGALDIEEDNDGNIWFGTFDDGLWRYNLTADQALQPPLISTKQTLVKYTAKDGLRSNYISTVYKDRQGKLWVGTGNGGVFTFNGKTFDELIIKQTKK